MACRCHQPEGPAPCAGATVRGFETSSDRSTRSRAGLQAASCARWIPCPAASLPRANALSFAGSVVAKPLTNPGTIVLSILPRTLKSIGALRAGALSRVAQFDKNETSDPRALKAEQDQRLRTLVLVAAEQVPFWKRRFARYGGRPGGVRSLKDLAVLPPLEDRDLVDFADELVLGGAPDPAWHTVCGLDQPRRRVRIDDEARRLRVADELRHIGWMGLDWRTSRALLAGRDERGEAP